MNQNNYLLVAISRLSLRRITSLFGLLAILWLCSDAAHSQIQPASTPGAVAEQSFFAPLSWAQELTNQQGWGPEYPRMLADVNGDQRQDVVGFGIHGVWLAASTGTSFSPTLMLLDFGYQSGWRVQKHVRTMGDINGDRLEDIVGFGNAGVYRALSTATGFSTTTFVVANFGYDQGWRPEKHVRLLADVNGDRRKDIVAFGDHGVWLSLATPSGFFTAPAFVVADFGFNQGWRPEKHIRTTADVNGDGLQDIVAFGDHGVWIALSTGNGFGPPKFALADFAYIAGGWRVEKHLRLMADIDKDGKQDIVGFGDHGVWVAHAAGSGFTAPQFATADFGYNQGWRVGKQPVFVNGQWQTGCAISSCGHGAHPRFVADLNGDGYQDIVGFGNEWVYRALGGPGGFGPMRGVLRALVVDQGHPWNAYEDVVPHWYPRMVGDVNGDGMQDLVAFDKSDIKVVRSSDLPPPPPPVAPSNLRVAGKTQTSLTVEWDDNSHDERKFLINYGKAGNTTQTVAVGANVTNRVFSSLESDTTYCFTVQAESLWGFSALSRRVCGVTNHEEPDKGPFTTSIFMARHKIVQGFIPYAGSFGPIYTGAIISNINFPEYFPPVLLVRPGHTTIECGNPAAVILVHGDMSAEQKQAIWGSATPTISGPQKLLFVGCSTGSELLDRLPVDITWRRP